MKTIIFSEGLMVYTDTRRYFTSFIVQTVLLSKLVIT